MQAICTVNNIQDNVESPLAAVADIPGGRGQPPLPYNFIFQKIEHKFISSARCALAFMRLTPAQKVSKCPPLISSRPNVTAEVVFPA